MLSSRNTILHLTADKSIKILKDYQLNREENMRVENLMNWSRKLMERDYKMEVSHTI